MSETDKLLGKFEAQIDNIEKSLIDIAIDVKQFKEKTHIEVRGLKDNMSEIKVLLQQHQQPCKDLIEIKQYMTDKDKAAEKALRWKIVIFSTGASVLTMFLSKIGAIYEFLTRTRP